MTFGELLGMNLHRHSEDVRAIVQRAVKDLSVEKTLKTYEEIWLGKLLELKEHARNRALIAQYESSTKESNNREGDTFSEASQPERGSRQYSRMSGTTVSRMRKTSVSSLPASMLNVDVSIINLNLTYFLN